MGVGNDGGTEMVSQWDWEPASWRIAGWLDYGHGLDQAMAQKGNGVLLPDLVPLVRETAGSPHSIHPQATSLQWLLRALLGAE